MDNPVKLKVNINPLPEFLLEHECQVEKIGVFKSAQINFEYRCGKHADYVRYSMIKTPSEMKIKFLPICAPCAKEFSQEPLPDEVCCVFIPFNHEAETATFNTEIVTRQE